MRSKKELRMLEKENILVELGKILANTENAIENVANSKDLSEETLRFIGAIEWSLGNIKSKILYALRAKEEFNEIPF